MQQAWFVEGANKEARDMQCDSAIFEEILVSDAVWNYSQSHKL